MNHLRLSQLLHRRSKEGYQKIQLYPLVLLVDRDRQLTSSVSRSLVPRQSRLRQRTSLRRMKLRQSGEVWMSLRRRELRQKPTKHSKNKLLIAETLPNQRGACLYREVTLLTSYLR